MIGMVARVTGDQDGSNGQRSDEGVAERQRPMHPTELGLLDGRAAWTPTSESVGGWLKKAHIWPGYLAPCLVRSLGILLVLPDR